MNLQQERIQLACETLKLESLHSEWSAIADHCAGNDHTYADFLERLLQVEVEARSQRSRETLLKFAGFPGRKLIEDYDFKFATGAPRARDVPYDGEPEAVDHRRDWLPALRPR